MSSSQGAPPVDRPMGQEQAVAPRRSWYSLTFSDSDDEGDSSVVHHLTAMPAATCNAASEHDDACSEASTDVGEAAVIDDESDDEAASTQHGQTSKFSVRSSLLRVDKAQRIEQLKRVVQEFCTLDFDSVDPSAHEGLVMRRLTLLKSLGDCATYYSEEKRTQQTRLALLGLDQFAHVFDDIALRAQHLCESRRFRAAFVALEEAVQTLRGETPASKQLSAEELEAMKLRRLQKRQRQRAERREDRRCERAQRSAQRWNGSHGR